MKITGWSGIAEKKRRDVFDDLEGEMSMRRNRENGRRRRSGGVYMLALVQGINVVLRGGEVR